MFVEQVSLLYALASPPGVASHGCVMSLHFPGSQRTTKIFAKQRGIVEAHFDDGLLEIFGLKQGRHASFVMVELISADHLVQAASIRVEIRGGQWAHAYMQMDGEPWNQPINKGFSTLVVIKRVPFQSFMISGFSILYSFHPLWGLYLCFGSFSWSCVRAAPVGLVSMLWFIQLVS
ncbi:Diacylglycerol kinase 4 [Asimina triloba]